jgi:hypothetical protein
MVDRYSGFEGLAEVLDAQNLVHMLSLSRFYATKENLAIGLGVFNQTKV